MCKSHHLLQLSVWPEYEACECVGGIVGLLLVPKAYRKPEIKWHWESSCECVLDILGTWPEVKKKERERTVPGQLCHKVPTSTAFHQRWHSLQENDKELLRGGRRQRGWGWGAARKGGRGYVCGGVALSPQPLYAMKKANKWFRL